eukprot:Trichotokara_eunicae@DN2710_c0_g1_i2.p1
MHKVNILTNQLYLSLSTNHICCYQPTVSMVTTNVQSGLRAVRMPTLSALLEAARDESLPGGRRLLCESLPAGRILLCEWFTDTKKGDHNLCIFRLGNMNFS